MSKSSDKPLKFEEAIAQLESIIDRIESGEIGLEDSIAQYERGMKLVARCQSVLATAQKRIAELTTDAAGKLQVRTGEDELPGAGEMGGGPGDAPEAEDADTSEDASGEPANEDDDEAPF